MLFLFLSIMIVPGSVNAAIKTAVANGNWAAGATWGGTAPAATDTCFIPSSINVTLAANATCGAVRIDGTLTNNSASTLTVQGGGTTPVTYGTVGGAITGTIITGTTNPNRGIITLSAGSWIFAGTFTGSRLTVNMTSTANNQTVSGALSCRVFTVVKSATTLFLTITPAISTTTTLTSGNIDYNGGAQEILAATYPANLTLSGTGPKTTPAGTTTTTVTGNFILGTGITYESAAGATSTLTLNGTSHTNNGILGSTVNPFNTVNIGNAGGDVLTNNNTMNVSASLGGTGNLTQGIDAALNIGGTSGISTLTATASGNTINYSGAAQTVKSTSYANLTLSGTGAKTTTGVTVNGILSMEGTAAVTASAAPTYGGSATLQYNKDVAFTAGVEWISPFTASGGVIIANSGVITMSSAEVFDASVPLTINSGATLNTSAANNWGLTLGGSFINNGGTLTANASSITIANTMTTQSIAGFTTTGTVSVTKSAGSATFTGNVNGDAFTLNGSGGTLNLGTGLTHTFTGIFTNTAGTLNLNSSTLNIGGTVVGTGATWNAGTSTVNYNSLSGGQSILAYNYYNLTVGNTSGVNTLVGSIGISNIFTPSVGTLTSAGTSTVNFINTTGGQSIPAFEYYNLTVSNTSGVNTLVGSIGIGNIFTPSAGTLTSAGTSTVNFNNTTGGQSIPAFDYYNLTVSNTSGVNTLTGTIGISNIFTPSAGALTSAGTSTIIYNGGGVQTVSAFTYNHLTLTSASPAVKTLGGAIAVNGNLTVNSNTTMADGGFQITGNAGGTFSLAAGSTLSLGNSSNATTMPAFLVYAFDGTSTVVYNSDQAQTISALPSYGHLTLTSTAGVTKTIASVLATAGNITVNVNNILNITGSGDVTVGGDFILYGNITNAGTLTIGP